MYGESHEQEGSSTGGCRGRKRYIILPCLFLLPEASVVALSMSLSSLCFSLAGDFNLCRAVMSDA